MSNALEQVAGAFANIQRKKAVAQLAVFVGGGVFGVLCFVAGYVVK